MSGLETTRVYSHSSGSHRTVNKVIITELTNTTLSWPGFTPSVAELHAGKYSLVLIWDWSEMFSFQLTETLYVSSLTPVI